MLREQKRKSSFLLVVQLEIKQAEAVAPVRGDRHEGDPLDTPIDRMPDKALSVVGHVQGMGGSVLADTFDAIFADQGLRELEAGHSVDVAIDCLGGEMMGKCIHYLTHGARWIMIAALAGTKTEIDLKNIYVRNVRIIGSTLRSRTPAVKAQILAGIVRDVYPKIEAGLVKPTIHATLPITEAEAAHDILYKGQNVGKVVLTVE